MGKGARALLRASLWCTACLLAVVLLQLPNESYMRSRLLRAVRLPLLSGRPCVDSMVREHLACVRAVVRHAGHTAGAHHVFATEQRLHLLCSVMLANFLVLVCITGVQQLDGNEAACCMLQIVLQVTPRPTMRERRPQRATLAQPSTKNTLQRTGRWSRSHSALDAPLLHPYSPNHLPCCLMINRGRPR